MTIPHSSMTGKRQHVRRELLRQYMRLQRELMDADPTSPAYQATMHAFRQMGYVLISSGFEEDLDRLLRIRVLDGGSPKRAALRDPSFTPELHIIEQRSAH